MWRISLLCWCLLVLAGGYDDGLVRCWLLGVHSTGQLRTVTITENGELAIPPLQYHSEWLAHDTEISGGERRCGGMT